MKNSNSISKLFLLAIILTSTFISTTTAQTYIRIANNWKPAYKIHIEKTTVDAGVAPDGWLSAQWELEEVSGENTFRIKNRWKKGGKHTYLHVENGKIEAGPIESGWVSAMWVFKKINGTNTYKIQNAWKTKQYLHIEGPTLAAGQIQPGWLSARWTLEETLNYNGKTVITFAGPPQQGGDCSLPEFISDGPSMKRFAENHFLPACQRHDHLYSKAPFIKAGITNGKEIIDNIFYTDMIQICRNGNFEGFGEKLYCERVAATWYFLVANAQEGHNAYANGQKKANKSTVLSKNLAHAKTIKKTGIYGDTPLLSGKGVKAITNWLFGE